MDLDGGGLSREQLVRVEERVNEAVVENRPVRVSFEDEVRTERLQKGEAIFDLGTFDEPGQVTVTIEYLGSDTHRRLTETFTFQVS